jgi:hypothetical protein
MSSRVSEYATFASAAITGPLVNSWVLSESQDDVQGNTNENRDMVQGLQNSVPERLRFAEPVRLTQFSQMEKNALQAVGAELLRTKVGANGP